MSVIRAVWPVVDESLLAIPDVLLAEALADLPHVAARAHAELTGPGRAWVAPGRLVPGSRAHAWVVVAEAPARTLLIRPYHHRRTA